MFERSRLIVGSLLVAIGALSSLLVVGLRGGGQDLERNERRSDDVPSSHSTATSRTTSADSDGGTAARYPEATPASRGRRAESRAVDTQAAIHAERARVYDTLAASGVPSGAWSSSAAGQLSEWYEQLDPTLKSLVRMQPTECFEAGCVTNLEISERADDVVETLDGRFDRWGPHIRLGVANDENGFRTAVVLLNPARPFPENL